MSTFTDKQWVWYLDADRYYHAAQFLSNSENNCNLRNIEGENVSIPKSNVKPMHPTSVTGVEDMITLGDLHEASLLHNISLRLMKDEIYTYTGNILVATNPYKAIAIFGGDYIQRYKGRSLGDLPPHIYAIANEAFYTMRRNNQNQCIVISGESGAGKTESTKLILNFLATVSSSKSLVQDQILDASPILEAFGNAKTVRNDNSSRFGKFLEVQFDTRGSIAGALTLQYLLEKSRIVKQAPEERNYHIFYAMLAGLSAEERQEFGLRSPQDFFYLNQSGCINMPNINDAGTLKEVREAFLTLNFKKYEKQIFCALSAILHLGNISFVESFGQNMDGVAIKDPSVIPIVAKMLSVDPAKLNAVLINRTSVTRGETFVTPLNNVQAIDGRDAMAKAIYGRMFSWIISSINESTAKFSAENRFVGVLDIFGFEDFKVNSFEQLCINYANERLQYYFNMHIFRMEQEEYTKEGINWSKIEFLDNQPTIDLISKKPIGLMLLLDDESNFSKSTDMTILGKFQQSHSDCKVFLKGRNQTSFGIHHYAGDVNYQIEGFLEKNRDTLRQDLQELLASSKDDLIVKWFTQTPEEIVTDGVSTVSSVASRVSSSSTGQRKSAKSLTTGYQFTLSLNDLITTLMACNPYFVRCIKPNSQKKTKFAERKLLIAQLSYSGMLETVRVRRAGYSNRTNFTDFLQRYAIINANVQKIAAKQPGEACRKIFAECKGIAKEWWEIGQTKVFMKSGAESILDGLRAERIMIFVLKLQAYFKMIVARSRYIRIKKATDAIQRAYRAHHARLHFKHMREGIIKAQAIYRGHRIRNQFKKEMTAIQVKQKAAEEQRVVDKKEGKRVAEEDALSIHSVDQAISQSDLANGRKIPWTSQLRSIAQKYSGVTLIPPLSVPEFIHLTTQTASLDPKNFPAAGLSEGDDGAITWESFCKVFFRESSKPRWSSRIIKESLLKWPDSCNQTAKRLYKTLLKLVVDELTAEETFIAVNYLVFKVIKMNDKDFEIPGNFRFYDELLCQIVKMTFENPDQKLALKAWKLLALFVGHFPPSYCLLKAIICYVTKDCPDADLSVVCKNRLARSNGRGPRRRGFTSIEVGAFIKQNTPIVLVAEWVDGKNPIPFEVDPACTPLDVISSLTRSRGLVNEQGYSMSVIFPDGRQLRLSKYDNILDMLALAELENKRMRQDYLQDAEVDGIQGKRKKPIVYPTQAVPSLVSNLPPPPAGQQLPHPPTAPSSMPPVSEGQQKAHSPIISANIPPAPLQNIPGISPQAGSPIPPPVAPKIISPAGAEMPRPGPAPNMQNLPPAPGMDRGPIARRMTAPSVVPSNLPPSVAGQNMQVPRPPAPRPSPGPPPPKPAQADAKVTPSNITPSEQGMSPQTTPSPVQKMVSPSNIPPGGQGAPQNILQNGGQRPAGPAPSNFPWRIMVKKAYISPACVITDPLDLQLTIEQIQQDFRAKDPYVVGESFPRLMQLQSAGDSNGAVKFAALWPLYFLQNFTVYSDEINSGSYLELGIHMKGIVLSTRGPDFVSRLFSRYRFDDLLVGGVEDETLSIWIEEKLYRFRFQGAKLASVVSLLIKSYIEELKDNSNVAVALVNFTAEEVNFGFVKGQMIELMERDRINGYFCGRVDGRTGWFPQDVVEVILSEPECENGLVKFKGTLQKKAEAAEARLEALRNESKMLMSSSDSLVKNALLSIFNPENGTSENQQLSFIEYAKVHFMRDFSNAIGTIRAMAGSIGTFRRSSTGSTNVASIMVKGTMDPKELARLVSFSSKAIKQPLTSLASPPEQSAAVTAFTYVMQFMGDLPTRKNRFELANVLVGMGMLHQQLVDELYCQIIKQIINNNSRKENSVKLGWKLLLIFCTFVVPSSTFEPYLRGHLTACATDKTRPFSKEASDCIQMLTRNKLSPRITNITPGEYTSLETGIKRRLKIMLPDGTFGMLTVDTHNTPRDFLTRFSDQFGLKPLEELGIWVVLQPGDFIAMPINIGVKTADILTNIEGLLMQSQGVYMDFQIRLFRKLWISDTELASEYSIKTTFNQLSASFAAGNMFINSDLAPENRTRLVKLVALFASMKQKSGNTETFKLNACIPSFLMNLYPPAEWVNQIAPHIEQYAKLQEKDAQTQFIKDVKLCGNYGFSGFLLGHTTDQRMPPGCSLAVGAKGVRIIEPAKRIIIEQFVFGEIVNFRYQPDEFAIRVAKAGENVVIRMETHQGPIIGDLISSYIAELNKIEARKQQEAGSVNVLAAEINAIV